MHFPSVCKSCLVKQMVDKNSPVDHCPTCQGPIEGFNGLRYFLSKSEEGFRWLAVFQTFYFIQHREDRQLQAIVNQVMPELEVNEKRRRKEFYEKNPKDIHEEEEDGVFDS